MNVPRRLDWPGYAVSLDEGFRLHKDRRTAADAVCRLRSPLGRALVLILAIAVATCGIVQATIQERWVDTERGRHFVADILRQDCPTPPFDKTAISKVETTLKADRQLAKNFGAVRKLRTRTNPKGRGILVSGFADRWNPGGSDRTRYRAVWLVLEGHVFALNGPARDLMAHSSPGSPRALKLAGLDAISDPTSWNGYGEQLGLPAISTVRLFSGENPFPRCPDEPD